MLLYLVTGANSGIGEVLSLARADSNQSKSAICRSSMLAIATTDRGFRLLKAVFIGFLCGGGGEGVPL